MYGCFRCTTYGPLPPALRQPHGTRTRFPLFFQAEDGIRDTSVTGVQTCALPIYVVGCRVGPERSLHAHRAAALGEIDGVPAQVQRYAVVVARQPAAGERFFPFVLVGETVLADDIAQVQREVAVADGPAAGEVNRMVVAKTPVAGRRVELVALAVQHFEANGIERPHLAAGGLVIAVQSG